MATRTPYKVVCNCGHQGVIYLRENDQPFSSSWEEYSLGDLNGEAFSTTSVADWNEVFERMNITCPKCNKSLTVKNMQN